MTDVDPETAALLRQMHLEFNGLNRNRRGKARIPIAKRIKREDGSHGPASGKTRLVSQTSLQGSEPIYGSSDRLPVSSRAESPCTSQKACL